jgi:Zn-dependent peptidase ImmA (M78 family)
MEEPKDKWLQALSTLEVWATDKGYYIDFSDSNDKDRDNCICSVSKIINIDGTLPIETQVYYLLHECGHALIFENGNHYDRRSLEKNAEVESSDEYKVVTVLEEAEAWKRGYYLAKRLLIPIEDERWKFEVTDAINKYILWSINIDWRKNK